MDFMKYHEGDKIVFAPGCALMLYKAELAQKLHLILEKKFDRLEDFHTCCHHEPGFETITRVINVCPGCDKRFGNDYNNSTTISLWEILAETDFFPFPDYHKQSMTILDACPTRDQDRVHVAIRKLVEKMNITLVEPGKTRTKSVCCGDSFYGQIPVENVKELMIKRSSEMPREDVIVYCVSCVKSVFIGGKKPRYLVDLLFSENTIPGTLDPDRWHRELEAYIESH